MACLRPAVHLQMGGSGKGEAPLPGRNTVACRWPTKKWWRLWPLTSCEQLAQPWALAVHAVVLGGYARMTPSDTAKQ